MCAYGKIILFGEHVVVYGYPALAVALSKGITCLVSTDTTEYILCIPQLGITANMQSTGTIASAWKTALESIPSNRPPCRLIVHSELPFGAGLGSSASLGVAIIRSLLSYNGHIWDNPKINSLAYILETIFHGTPSGIDNTMATYGGVCLVADTSKYNLPSCVESHVSLGKLTAGFLPKPKSKISLLVINTNKERETKKIVANVKLLYQSKPVYYEKIFADIGQLAMFGYECWQQEKYDELGRLLNYNHECLQKLEVSCAELDDAWKEVQKAGAIGAKLTGAGAGGCLIALAPGREQVVMQNMQNLGWSCFISEIG